MLKIRNFEKGDYEECSAVINELYPDRRITPEELAHIDAHRPKKAQHKRWVAELDGHVAGMGERFHDLWDYDPKKYEVDISVSCARQGQGIGNMLYDTVAGSFDGLGAIELNSWVREYHPKGIRFLEKRGYVETLRLAMSRLDLREVDTSTYSCMESGLLSKGIEIHTLAEMECDKERDAKLHRFDSLTARDVPGVSSVPDLEDWKEEVLNSPRIIPDGFFIAVFGDAYVGTSTLEKTGSPDSLEIGYTGVKKEYRSMGIATALKAKGIMYAKRMGYKFLETGNEVNNEKILSINRKLGFARMPDWIRYTLGRR